SGAFNERVEHGLKVGRRSRDYAQYVAGHSLMFQRFREVAIALSQFLEQPHVFKCDHRLIAKGFEKFDLFVRKWSDFHASNENSSNRNTFAEQRHGESRPGATSPTGTGSVHIRELAFRHRIDVVDVSRPSIDDCTTAHCPPADS